MKCIAKTIIIGLVGIVLCGALTRDILAQTVAESSTEKIRTDVQRRGVQKIVVKMKDGRKLKGTISKTGDESFDLTNSKTWQTTTIAYGDVAQIKKPGLSKGAKIAITIGGVAGVVVLAVILNRRPLGSFCPLGCGPF